LFDIPSIANWKKIGDLGNVKLITCVNAFKIVVKILVRKQVISAKKSM